MKLNSLLQSLLVRADAVPFSPLRKQHNVTPDDIWGVSPAHLPETTYYTVPPADLRLVRPFI